MREVIKVGHRCSPCDGWCPHPKVLYRASACEVLRWHSPSRRFVTALHFFKFKCSTPDKSQQQVTPSLRHANCVPQDNKRSSSRQQTNEKHKAAKQSR